MTLSAPLGLRQCLKHPRAPRTEPNINGLSFCTECVKEAAAKDPKAFVGVELPKARRRIVEAKRR